MGRKNAIQLLLTVCIFLMLIFKNDIVAAGAMDGIWLCLQVIVPSLFPFFFVSCYLNPLLAGIEFRCISKLCKHLGIPHGCESIVLLGLIGGYPVGAQAVASAFRSGKIGKQQSQRLLGFCNNAGPAFIFGVCATLFSSYTTAWFLWLIHISSALITALLLPKTGCCASGCFESSKQTLVQAFRQSINVTVSVCGWIIIFKSFHALILSTLNVQNAIIKTLLAGILELSGGSLALTQVDSLSLRFILASALLAFGGVCVILQTASVCGEIGLGFYISGKITQTLLSILFSAILVIIQHRNTLSATVIMILLPVCIIAIFAIMYLIRKKLWK